MSAARAKEAFAEFVAQHAAGPNVVVQLRLTLFCVVFFKTDSFSRYVSVSSALTGAELEDDASLSPSSQIMLAAAIQFKGYPLRLIDNLII